MSLHLSSQTHPCHSPPPPPPPPPPPIASSKLNQENPCIQLTIQTTIPPSDLHDHGQTQPNSFDYSARAQWLRAAVLGANDGLVSVASLMIGVGAVNKGTKAMLVTGLAGLVAGACSMAMGELVSVYTQYDIEVAQMERHKRETGREASNEEMTRLPSPFRAAGASFMAFALGAIFPLLAGGFIHTWWIRVAVVCFVTSLGLAGFGAAGAVLGDAHVGKSMIRVLVGGWMAMAFTYGVLKAFGVAFGMKDIS